MRMRRKPWVRPELAQCDFFINTPELFINNWNTDANTTKNNTCFKI